MIVALDQPNLETAGPLVDRLAPLGVGFKVGLTLHLAQGREALAFVRERCRGPLFLDLKWHDIPKQVREAAYVAAQLGVDLATCHALGGRQMIAAAAQGLADGAAFAGLPQPALLAVTLLTSLNQKNVSTDLGLSGSVSENVLRLADVARANGASGVVCSGQEVSALRQRHPDKTFLLVVPGVRPAHASVHQDDQQRTVTPSQAIANGASHVVVGRAITQALDPKAACVAILEAAFHDEAV